MRTATCSAGPPTHEDAPLTTDLPNLPLSRRAKSNSVGVRRFLCDVTSLGTRPLADDCAERRGRHRHGRADTEVPDRLVPPSPELEQQQPGLPPNPPN